MEKKGEESFMHPCKIFVDTQCDCIGECGSDASRAWLKSAQEVSYDYPGDYINGIEDFKLALKAKIEGMIQINQSIKRLSDIHRDGKTIGLMIALASIDEVKPIQK